MADTPRVTLGLTTFNVERYLAGALDSVLAQDFTDFEVVVCDNGSTDATWEICQRYASRDSRFRIYRNESNLGLSGNVSRVVSLAGGEYFRLTAHDDLLAPGLLGRCVEALDAHPGAVLAYPRGIVIDGDGTELFACHDEPDLRATRPSRRILDLVRTWQYFNEQFGVIRTDVLRRTGLIRPFAASDLCLLVELAARGEFHLVDEPLFFRRQHAQNSFDSGRTAREHYEWLEPGVARQRRFAGKSAKGDFRRITTETTKALLFNELPRATRLATAATFATVWPLRRARVVLGASRRRMRQRASRLWPSRP
jgi:glycosyltransferase involved in cell wall biosynthesis